MCCVMPPNSPATTSVSRIASSSLVLPWSTWPMTVTTGGRGTSADSSTSSSSSSSQLVLDADDLGVMAELGRDQRRCASSESDVVAVTISPAMNRIFTMSAGLLADLLGDRLRRRTAHDLQDRQRAASGTTGLRGPRGWRPVAGTAVAERGRRPARPARAWRRRPRAVAARPAPVPPPADVGRLGGLRRRPWRPRPSSAWACAERAAARAPRGASARLRWPCRREARRRGIEVLGHAGGGGLAASPPSARGSPAAPCW